MARPKKAPAESELGTEPAKKPGPAPKKYVVLVRDEKDESTWHLREDGEPHDSISAATEVGTYWAVPEQVSGKNLFVASKVEKVVLS